MFWNLGVYNGNFLKAECCLSADVDWKENELPYLNNLNYTLINSSKRIVKLLFIYLRNLININLLLFISVQITTNKSKYHIYTRVVPKYRNSLKKKRNHIFTCLDNYSCVFLLTSNPAKYYETQESMNNVSRLRDMTEILLNAT